MYIYITYNLRYLSSRQLLWSGRRVTPNSPLFSSRLKSTLLRPRVTKSLPPDLGVRLPDVVVFRQRCEYPVVPYREHPVTLHDTGLRHVNISWIGSVLHLSGVPLDFLFPFLLVKTVTLTKHHVCIQYTSLGERRRKSNRNPSG